MVGIRDDSKRLWQILLGIHLTLGPHVSSSLITQTRVTDHAEFQGKHKQISKHSGIPYATVNSVLAEIAHDARRHPRALEDDMSREVHGQSSGRLQGSGQCGLYFVGKVS